VEQLHAMRREEDVRWFQIAMNESSRMQRVERGSHRQRHARRFVERQRAAIEPARERLAIEQLHDQKWLAVFIADVEQLTYIRMIERRRRTRLTKEAVARQRIARIANGLDRHLAMQPLILGDKDHTH